MNLSDQTPRRAGVGYRPWQTRTEFLVDQALDANFAEDDALRNMPPPAHNRNGLFPDRTGLRRTEPTIHDVLNIDRYVPTNRSWVSGFPIEYQAGERVYSNNQGAEGSTRNSMSAGWV